MPYFVYKIFEKPIRHLQMAGQFDAFRPASERAKQMRGELSSEAGSTIKVIFAETELHAEDLLNQAREPIHNPQDD